MLPANNPVKPELVISEHGLVYRVCVPAGPFTEHKIQQPSRHEVDSPVAFGTFSVPCNHHSCPAWECFQLVYFLVYFIDV